jgi:hypothetical protein
MSRKEINEIPDKRKEKIMFRNHQVAEINFPAGGRPVMTEVNPGLTVQVTLEQMGALQTGC